MLTLYRIALYFLTPFVVLKLLLRSIKAPAYRRRIGERFGLIDIHPPAGGVWVHAVSVGEAIAAVKLIRAVQHQYPQLKVTVTCGTPTGSEVITQQLGDSVFHVYLPYDLPGSVQRFLSRVQPRLGIILETEIWPNLLQAASRQGICMVLSNMRLSKTSFSRYCKVKGLVSRSLACFDSIAAQTDADASRVRQLGADSGSVHVVGNLKFEMAAVHHADSARSVFIQQLTQNRPVWVAGSTHAGEDEQVLEVHAGLLLNTPELLLILAPRHPERFEAVHALCRQQGRVQRRSEITDAKAFSAGSQVLLLDSIGELSDFIQHADWAFIGGSLVPVGGHNLLEACEAGVPVIYGPHMHNFKQVAQIVEQQQAGVCVETPQAFLEQSLRLLEDPDMRARMGEKGRQLVIENRGALKRTMKLLEACLSSDK